MWRLIKTWSGTPYFSSTSKSCNCRGTTSKSSNGSPVVAVAGKNNKRVNKAATTSLLYDIAKEIAAQASMSTDSEVRSKVDPKSVACMILGGEAGSRLFPLTKRRAKSAVPMGGAYRLIDIQMSNCINSGINKVYVLTQFNSASLNRHISRTYNSVTCRDGFVEVLAATQTLGDKRWFMGTADAVRRFSWIFDNVRSEAVEHVLVLSGDHLYRMNYMDLVQNHHTSGADITVSCVPLSMDDSSCQVSAGGLLRLDHKGRVLSIHDKAMAGNGYGLSMLLESAAAAGSGISQVPEGAAKNSPFVASMGLYVFKKDVLIKLLKWFYPNSNDFASEIIPAAAKDFYVQAYLFNNYWQDVGTIESYFEANLALTDQQPKFEFYDVSNPIYTSPRYLPPTTVEHCRIVDSIVSHGCFLRSCSVQHSIIGIRSRIESGVQLNDVVMIGADDYETEEERRRLLALGKVPMGVGENSKIKRCIIDKNARIGKNVILTNTDGVREAEQPSDGIYIRSGIIVVSENALIKDGMVI
ncbi:hypothetical protein Mapa_013184 [Marchantia paleacea]|nr:hypothetical protein Mapa_013184 [Marchantia paleacea]